MPILDLPTHRLHYVVDAPEDDVDGAAPWLVFDNSLGTDLTMWDAQAAALSSTFCVLRYDRRGHGLSTSPAPPFSLADLGGDVVALLDALQIARVHVCGLSIGGLVAQWLAINVSERIDRVVVAATAAKIGTADSWQQRITAVTTSGLAPLVPATAERWFGAGFRDAHDNEVQRVLAAFPRTSIDGYIGCCAALAEADLRPYLRGIERPLLAIAGDDDPVTPASDLQFIAENVVDGRVLTLPGRHLVNIESSSAFSEAVRAFLRG